MKRSDMLTILAKRLGNREVEDIYEDALLEMEFVQESVLEKLPSQPWFIEQDEVFPLPAGTTVVTLPERYNGLMTRGGVWIAPATLLELEPV